MPPLKAQVRNGRLVLDEPTDLPEGEVIYLVPMGEGAELDDKEREALEAALEESFAAADRGEVYDAEEVLAELEAET